MVYAWGEEPYPNGAVFLSLQPRLPAFKRAFQFIMERNRGFGFQEADLTYDLPLDMVVLPCAWFDPAWGLQGGPFKDFEFDDFLVKRPVELTACTLDNFHPESFAYHWHNRWEMPVHNDSCMADLNREIQNRVRV